MQALTHITELNKLKQEYSSLTNPMMTELDLNHNPLSHHNIESQDPLLSPQTNVEDEKMMRRGVQRSRAGRPMKHKTPKEKQTAHSEFKI